MSDRTMTTLRDEQGHTYRWERTRGGWSGRVSYVVLEGFEVVVGDRLGGGDPDLTSACSTSAFLAGCLHDAVREAFDEPTLEAILAVVRTREGLDAPTSPRAAVASTASAASAWKIPSISWGATLDDEDDGEDSTDAPGARAPRVAVTPRGDAWRAPSISSGVTIDDVDLETFGTDDDEDLIAPRFSLITSAAPDDGLAPRSVRPATSEQARRSLVSVLKQAAATPSPEPTAAAAPSSGAAAPDAGPTSAPLAGRAATPDAAQVNVEIVRVERVQLALIAALRQLTREPVADLRARLAAPPLVVCRAAPRAEAEALVARLARLGAQSALTV